MSQQQKQGTHPSFFVLILVFFFWGFLAASNSIFIPFCKSHFNLTQLESQLIDFAFYSAYFIGSLILYFLSAARKIDILNKIGYKKGIIYGLLISVFGSVLMIPAVNKERIVPIQETVADINNFSAEQQLQTTDRAVKIRKDAKGDGYTIAIPFGDNADKYVNDAQLLPLVNGNAFAKNDENKEYTAGFAKANIEPIVSELATAHNQTVTFGYFALILGALFIVALGFSLQQTAANPFAVLLGNPEQGANRLSLAGGINSFGTTIGPILVSFLLFGKNGGSVDNASISSINTLYILLIVLFLVAAGIFAITKMPEATDADEQFESSPKASRSLLWITGMFILILLGLVFKMELTCFIIGIVGIIGTLLYSKSAAQSGEGWGAMKYPQLVLGMLAIFIYVGVEVSIASNMGALLKHPGFLTEHGLKESELDPFVSLFWGSLMIGRWTSAISVFNVSVTTRKILSVIVPFIAYGVVLAANLVKGTDVSNLYPYAICIVIQIIGFLAAQDKPAKTLMIFGILGVAFMLFGIFTTGYVSTFAFVSGGLFCSVMWPCIYALSISGLGKYTGQASSFLVLMILGGSLIPPVQGGLADIPAIGIHLSYIIPALCFAYIAFFAFRVKSILKSQGIDYESAVSGGH